MTRSAGPQKDARTGTWAFVCDLGIGPNGNRRQARRRGFKTRREAQEALDKLRVSARDGTFVEPTKLTLAAWLERWCDGLATLGRSPGTIESYRRQMLTHVVPTLGAVRLVRLSAADLDTLYSRLLATGRCDGRGGLSPRTVRYVHTIASKALSDAVRKRLLVRNPALEPIRRQPSRPLHQSDLVGAQRAASVPHLRRV